MRLRTLLAATTAGALAGALAIGVAGPAHAVTAPPPAGAGTLLTWGDEADPNGQDAIPVPVDLGPVTSVAANAYATGVVTLDGGVRVWGDTDKSEVGLAPAGVTDATAIALTNNNGAVLHADGHVTAWGDSMALSEVPSDLRARAIALQVGTGYAVRPDGTLATWGDEPAIALPPDLTGLVDVAAPAQVLALREDGTVVTWGPALPGLLDVPDFEGKKAVQIAAGTMYSGVVLDDGSIKIWGFAPQIPAGQPDFDGSTPAKRVVSLSLSFGHAAAVTADGAVHVWGAEAPVTEDIPTELTGGEPVSTVALGTTHAAAVITAFRDIAKPSIAGQPTVGKTLTATPATFSLTPDAATGQWYAGNDPINGQTAATLTLGAGQLGKSISYRTTATRGEQTVVSASTPVGPVASATVASATTLAVDPATGGYGATRTVTATVAKSGGTPTGTVTFKVGTTEGAASLTGGTATWTLPASLAVGSHQITAAYGGDATTDPSTSAALTLTVDKASSKLKAGKAKVKKAKGKKATKKVAKKVTITVTVKTADGVSPTGKVSLTLKGKTKKKATAKVNAHGKAKITLKKVKRGKYKAKLKYTGDANVAAAKTTKKLKI